MAIPPNQSPDPEAQGTALELLGLIETLTTGEIHSALLALSEDAYKALRESVLGDPAGSVDCLKPNEFLKISQLRAEWLIKGWKSFFENHPDRPRIVSENSVSASACTPKSKGRHSMSFCGHDSDWTIVRNARRQLEDSGLLRVTDSAVVRIGLRTIPKEKSELVRLYHLVLEEDLRRREKKEKSE